MYSIRLGSLIAAKNEWKSKKQIEHSKHWMGTSTISSLSIRELRNRFIGLKNLISDIKFRGVLYAFCIYKWVIRGIQSKENQEKNKQSLERVDDVEKTEHYLP